MTNKIKSIDCLADSGSQEIGTTEQEERLLGEIKSNYGDALESWGYTFMLVGVLAARGAVIKYLEWSEYLTDCLGYRKKYE